MGSLTPGTVSDKRLAIDVTYDKNYGEDKGKRLDVSATPGMPQPAGDQLWGLPAHGGRCYGQGYETEPGAEIDAGQLAEADSKITDQSRHQLWFQSSKGSWV